MFRQLTPLFLLLGLAACVGTPETKASGRRVIAELETNLNGSPIKVPHEPKVVATLVRILPGESMPAHKHLYQRYAYMLKGELEVTLEDEHRVIHAKPGDFVAETVNGWHSGVNKGTEPVEILVIDQMPKSAKTNMVFKEKRP
ncbi:MAG: cupin domain-containing protein [Alphaproteobacteria bacterium]|nr:cupin domain-containing protein [Alphaproteobacteria bacterium]